MIAHPASSTWVSRLTGGAPLWLPRGLPLLIAGLVAWGGGQRALTAGPAATALLAAVVVSLSVSRARPAVRLQSWIERHDRSLLLVALAAIFTWGLAAALLRFAWYNGHIDLAHYDNLAWNTTQGRVYQWWGGNHLAYHITAVPLLTLPFYVLAAGPQGLLFVQSLAVVAVALPLHALARRGLPPLPSLLLAAALPLLPALFSRHLDDFQETPFFALPFLLALLFFEQGRFRPFLICALAASILIIEYYAIVLGVFSVYALWRRRPLAWVLAPAAIGLTWAALVWGMVLPYFRAQQEVPYPLWGIQYYLHLGAAPADILGTFLRDPLGGLFADPLSAGQRAHVPMQLSYLRDLFLPFLLVLPLGGPEALFALPELLKNLPTGHPAILSVTRHHSMLVSTALIAATVTTLSRLHGAHPSLVRGLAAGVLCLAAFSPATTFMALMPRSLLAAEPPPFADAIAMIQPEASVVASIGALSHLSRRRQILYPAHPKAGAAIQAHRVDAVLLDQWSADPKEQALRRAVAGDPAYRLLYERERVVLYVLDRPPGPSSGDGPD